MVVSAVEGAVVVGGLSALGAALVSIGIPQNSVITYESAIKADKFLVMAHGSNADVSHAKTILEKSDPANVTIHDAAATNMAA